MDEIDILKNKLKELNKKKRSIVKEISKTEVELENIINSTNQYKLL